jgi:hypothetical protein
MAGKYAPGSRAYLKAAIDALQQSTTIDFSFYDHRNKKRRSVVLSAIEKGRLLSILRRSKVVDHPFRGGDVTFFSYGIFYTRNSKVEKIAFAFVGSGGLKYNLKGKQGDIGPMWLSNMRELKSLLDDFKRSASK